MFLVVVLCVCECDCSLCSFSFSYSLVFYPIATFTILLNSVTKMRICLLLTRCMQMLVLFSCRFIIVMSLCRSAAAFLRARNPSPLVSNSEFGEDAQLTKPASLTETKDSTHQKQQQRLNFQFPFGDWSSHPWSKPHENQQNPRF